MSEKKRTTRSSRPKKPSKDWQIIDADFDKKYFDQTHPVFNRISDDAEFLERRYLLVMEVVRAAFHVRDGHDYEEPLEGLLETLAQFEKRWNELS